MRYAAATLGALAIALAGCGERVPTIASMGGNASGNSGTAITVSPTTATVAVGSTTQLLTNYAADSVQWSSLTPDVAGVSATGSVLGLRAGTATIRVRLQRDTTNAATATVTVVGTGTTGG